MNAAHLHLMTAHVPVLGVPFAGALLAAGLIGRSETLWRAGCVALLLAAAAAAVPYFSGPAAYEFVKQRFDVPASPVERHAVVARAASLGLVLLGAVTASGLLRDLQGDRPSKPLRLLILAGAVVITYALAWAAHLGGLVRHPELGDPPLRVFPALPALISFPNATVGWASAHHCATFDVATPGDVRRWAEAHPTILPSLARRPTFPPKDIHAGVIPLACGDGRGPARVAARSRPGRES